LAVPIDELQQGCKYGAGGSNAFPKVRRADILAVSGTIGRRD
jgi:hypothetical protein